jgi:hypothetical protein
LAFIRGGVSLGEDLGLKNMLEMLVASEERQIVLDGYCCDPNVVSRNRGCLLPKLGKQEGIVMRRLILRAIRIQSQPHFQKWNSATKSRTEFADRRLFAPSDPNADYAMRRG